MEAVFENGVFRPLAPEDLSLADGQRVRLTVETKPLSADPLALAAAVFDGMSPEQIRQVEQIALDRSWFFDPPAQQ